MYRIKGKRVTVVTKITSDKNRMKRYKDRTFLLYNLSYTIRKSLEKMILLILVIKEVIVE